PDSTNATASALNCSEYNFDMINILPCPAPAKQARRQPNPQQTRRVLATAMDILTQTGKVPSGRTVGQELGITRQQANRHLKALCEAGLI
ncbi:helix-turn-helix transcriptional regulator, partial [Corynebacterium belfantii]